MRMQLIYSGCIQQSTVQGTVTIYYFNMVKFQDYYEQIRADLLQY